MATLEELESALIKADAAGNADDARVFAREIRRLRAESQAPQGLPLSQEQQQAVTEIQASPDKGGVANFLTGSDRTVPDIKELDADQVFGLPWGDHPAENFKVSAGTLMTFDDEARKNIWDEQLKSAGVEHRWEKDPFGNALEFKSFKNDSEIFKK